VLTLPSFTEGSALVTFEGRASGCVLAVSDAAGAPASHRVDALIHHSGDEAALSEHFDVLASNPSLWDKLRVASLRGRSELSWDHAGKLLTDVYAGLLKLSSPAR
jgi:glycosyltransferase involved in cell wall biosynthesis